MASGVAGLLTQHGGIYMWMFAASEVGLRVSAPGWFSKPKDELFVIGAEGEFLRARDPAATQRVCQSVTL